MPVDLSRTWQYVALAVSAATIGGSGCGESSNPSCDELRAELAAIDVTAAAAWDDIAVLQNDVERGLQLQRTIEERCG